jgi:thiol-disulfide isomerase/thioredoxin
MTNHFLLSSLKLYLIVGLTSASVAALAVTSSSSGDSGASSSPSGIWIGTAHGNEHDVPLRLELSVGADGVRGNLVNGIERSASSSGDYTNGHLVLHFDYYANTLDANLKDGTLSGTFSGRGRSIPITARLNGQPTTSDSNAPRIAGVWDVAVENGAKGEHTWKVRIRQNGANVIAVIERIDGDTGNLYGTWHDGAFEVSHFTAAGPSFAVLQPLPDGTLKLQTAAHGGGLQSFAAHRVQRVKQVVSEPADDPFHHTYLKNPGRPLSFSFPDLNGKLVSNTDPQFARKVVIVSVGGSWCPNCQEEAPFFEALYRKYHGRGLEIVDLSFEEEAQLQNPVRLRAVIQRYGITYPVLVAGTPEQLNEKIQHVANLNCWPTTFFVGKDGLVKATHTGYAGAATGEDNRKLENEITAQVERLLAEKDSIPRSKPSRVANMQ